MSAEEHLLVLLIGGPIGAFGGAALAVFVITLIERHTSTPQWHDWSALVRDLRPRESVWKYRKTTTEPPRPDRTARSGEKPE